MFSELAGSGSLLFCQNKADMTALPLSLCPNFSFLSSFHLPFSFSIRDIISEILSSCSVCHNQKDTLLEPTLEERPDASVICCFLSSGFLLFAQLRGQTPVLPVGWSGTQEGHGGIAGCRRQSSAAGSGAAAEVELRTGNTSHWAEDLHNRCEYGSLSWNPENKILPKMLSHLLSLQNLE